MEAIMSKRHKKSKITFSSQGGDEDIHAAADYDLSMYEAPKGKKPKGRQKRDSHKRAYYDD
jgi:hypothetical protein